MVNVIGMGYIGLPTALMLAANGVEVVGTDYDINKIEKLQKGQVTFKEDGLESLFDQAVTSGITFTKAYKSADVYIIAVPTPYDNNSKRVDASYVISAMMNVIEVCPNDSIVIIESTIAPGTIDRHIRPLLRSKSDKKNIHLAHAPERIIPGHMVYELINNNRTIGVDDIKTGNIVKSIYSSFCKGEIVLTDIKTAEMTKVVENSFRSVNIGFANELAKICHAAGMDVNEIIRICNLHPRVNILNPGPGVGGHCIPIDPWFLVGDFPGLTNIINSALLTNASMPSYVLNRIYEIMQDQRIKDCSKVGLYGLTYKENVDDVRESPALQLLDVHNRHLGSGIKVYDPFVNTPIVANQYHDFEQFLDDIDIIVIMIKHTHIINKMDKLMGKVVLDCCNICNFDGVYHL